MSHARPGTDAILRGGRNENVRVAALENLAMKQLTLAKAGLAFYETNRKEFHEK